jgi:DNA-binding PucR family transcriptional regulator
VKRDEGLRRKAEERLASGRTRKSAVPSRTEADLLGLVHELEVHQIELERQNEELQRTQAEPEDSRARWAEAEQSRLILELQESASRVKQLTGLLPICASCKRIRDDSGYWQQVEEYVSSHSEAEFTHGLCPECLQKLYPEHKT